jgi:Kef-type K+ transport system membrane component KefB
MNDLLLSLAVILVAAEAGAAAANAARLPRAVGQIGAGLLLGPSLLGVVHQGDVIETLSQVGAFLILAVAGLETNLAVMRRVGRAALLAAVGGVVLPFGGGLAVAMLTGYGLTAALFVGAVLTATSVGITAAVLGELGLLRSSAGMTILGAAVIDDVLGLVVLALVVASTSATGGSPLLVLVPMAVTLAVSALAMRRLAPRLHAVMAHLHGRGGGHAAMLGTILLVGWTFQVLGGLAGITGAYLVGLAFAASPVAESLRERLVHAGEAFCVPIFFVAIGLAADLRAVPAVLPVALALLGVALAGKVAGCGVGAALGGLDGRASALVGVGMVARGEVALVAASLGLRSGAIDAGLYAAIVLVALASTIAAPIGISGWARWASRSRGGASAPAGHLAGDLAALAGVRALADVE